MQLLTTLTAILLALTPIATADFSLYQVGKGGTGIVANIEGWQVYANTPNTIGCDRVRESINLGQRPDVSGKKTGVRCKTAKGQCGRSGGGGNILELEFNRARAGGGRHHFSKSKALTWEEERRCKDFSWYCTVALTLHRLSGSLL